MPPSDPRSTPKPATNAYVLDIDDLAIQPSKETNLIIRKKNERRKATQTWKFCVRNQIIL